MKNLPSATRNLEPEISARLAYVEIIQSLQKERSEQGANRDTRTAAIKHGETNLHITCAALYRVSNTVAIPASTVPAGSRSSSQYLG